MKAFIFDLDGVIVFTDKFHYQAWKSFLKKAKRNIAGKKNRHLQKRKTQNTEICYSR